MNFDRNAHTAILGGFLRTAGWEPARFPSKRARRIRGLTENVRRGVHAKVPRIYTPEYVDFSDKFRRIPPSCRSHRHEVVLS